MGWNGQVKFCILDNHNDGHFVGEYCAVLSAVELFMKLYVYCTVV